MRLRERVKVLKSIVVDLVRKKEVLEGRMNELEDEFENLLKPVLEAFEKQENNAPTGVENSDKPDYNDLINEYLNGKENK